MCAKLRVLTAPVLKPGSRITVIPGSVWFYVCVYALLDLHRAREGKEGRIFSPLLKTPQTLDLTHYRFDSLPPPPPFLRVRHKTPAATTLAREKDKHRERSIDSTIPQTSTTTEGRDGAPRVSNKAIQQAIGSSNFASNITNKGNLDSRLKNPSLHST